MIYKCQANYFHGAYDLNNLADNQFPVARPNIKEVTYRKSYVNVKLDCIDCCVGD